MDFKVEQPVAAPPDLVAQTYADPEFYAAMGSIPEMGEPQVLAYEAAEADGTVRLQVRFAFVGELSGAVRSVIDPARLTWVTHSEVRPAQRLMTFHLVPDFYPDRLTCSGTYRFVEEGKTTSEVVEGELAVHFPLVAHSVERAILDGFRKHLAEEAALLEEWVLPPG